MQTTRRFISAVVAVSLLLVGCSLPVDLPSPAPVTELDRTQTAMPHPTDTPKATYTSTPLPTFTPAPTPTPVGGGSGQLIFAANDKDSHLNGTTNVFVANWDGTGLSPVTNGLNGYNYVESVSPDGERILISSFSKSLFYVACRNCSGYGDLYIVNLTQLDLAPRKIAGHVIKKDWRNPAAIWLNNDRVVYIGMYGGESGLFSVSTNGTGLAQVSQQVVPFSILPPATNGRVYWESISGYTVRYWWSSIDGSQQEQIARPDSASYFDISPDKTKVIWTDYDYGNFAYVLKISSMSDIQGSQRTIGSIPDLRVLGSYEISWSPDSSRILVMAQQHTYSKDSQPPFRTYASYLISLADYALTELPGSLAGETLHLDDDLRPNLARIGGWAPDNKQVVLQYFIAKWVERRVVRYVPLIFNVETRELSTEFNSNVDFIGTDINWSILWLLSPQ